MDLKIEILKDKWCGMRKLAKNRESRQFSQSWDIRNTSSILPIQDKKRSTSSMNKLSAIRKPAFHGKETVNYDDVVAFV